MNNSELCEKAKKLEDRGEIEKAYQFYLEAAIAEDDGEAMKALADMYLEGDFVSSDLDKAGRYFGLAYDRKAEIDPMTLIYAGAYWERQEKHEEESLLFALKYYQAAADMGVSYGHECLADVYINMGEYEKAYEHLIIPEKYNTLGLYLLGKMYEEGLYVEADLDKAIAYYKQTVEEGADCEEDLHYELALGRLKELGIE